MVPSVKSDLQEIHHAETKAAAMAAIEAFKEKYAVKYVPAVASRVLRTSNPIESVFATVRHRTVRTKGALSQKTAKLTVFDAARPRVKTWRKLKGANQLSRVIEGVKFTNGVAVVDAVKTRAA